MTYDKAKWHYGGNYPSDLPPENGATHIGIFLAWCIESGLYSEELEDMSHDAIEQVKQKKLSGAQFLISECDECFTDEDLNDEGNAFAAAYYESESDFAKNTGNYFNDYCGVIDEYSAKTGSEYETVYHFEDTWEHYDSVAKKITERYNQWLKTR